MPLGWLREPFSVQKWPFLASLQDDRHESSRRSMLRQPGISNEGRCSSVVTGLSKECKWVFNEASHTPWCNAVVNFEVKTSRF